VDSNTSTQASNISKTFKLVSILPLPSIPLLSPILIEETNNNNNVNFDDFQKKPVNDDTSQGVPHNIKYYKYNTINHNFKPNSIHLVDISSEIKIQLTPEIINTLILGLKFIPILKNHLKNLITCITVYSQHTKQILKPSYRN
jgi:hypothetical protein